MNLKIPFKATLLIQFDFFTLNTTIPHSKLKDNSGAGTAYLTGAPPGFSGVRVTRSLVFCVVFCRSLFVLLSFFFRPLCCLSFLGLRILISPLVSSNSSCQYNVSLVYCLSFSFVHCIICPSIYCFWYLETFLSTHKHEDYRFLNIF